MPEDAPDTYNGAQLTVYLSNFPDLSFTVPIIASIQTCNVEKLKFEAVKLSLSY